MRQQPSQTIRPAKKRSRRQQPRQEKLPFPERGGKRRGAGRKRAPGLRRVSHKQRGRLGRHDPVHVTTRLCPTLPQMRNVLAYQVIRSCFRKGRNRFGFRLVHFAVLGNHFHFIVEAEDNRALARGMQGLLVRLAKNLNKFWRRKGKVFADRFHDHILRKPLEVRRALCYVLHNARKHGIPLDAAIDPFTSGQWFDGWKEAIKDAVHPPVTRLTRCVTHAASWLLTKGWRRHPLISVHEKPGARMPMEVPAAPPPAESRGPDP